MKKRVTITVDESLFNIAGLDKRNVSGYFNELLKDAIHQQNKETIYAQVKRRLLEDVDFSDYIFNKVQEASSYK
jgi:hypothetical protein